MRNNLYLLKKHRGMWILFWANVGKLSTSAENIQNYFDNFAIFCKICLDLPCLLFIMFAGLWIIFFQICTDRV